MMTSRIVLLTAMAALCAAPAESQRSKHTYVIVHGAWGGGWDWRHVDSLLSASGNRVYRPTLTGLGERIHLASPTTDLSTHITDIVNVIRYEDLRDVVLVGHSYGGMVISGVADRIPDRIRRLVFIDAFVPEDGESVLTASRGTKIEPRVRLMLDSAKNGVMAPFWVKPDTPAPIDVPQPEKNLHRTADTPESGEPAHSGYLHPDRRSGKGRSGGRLRAVCAAREVSGMDLLPLTIGPRPGTHSAKTIDGSSAPDSLNDSSSTLACAWRFVGGRRRSDGADRDHPKPAQTEVSR